MKLTNLLYVLQILLMYASIVSAATPESIKQESEATARSMDSQLKGYFTSGGAAELQGTIGYDANAPIEGQGMAIEQSEGLGSAKRGQIYEASEDYQCNKQNCEVGHTFSTKATIARENEIENTGFIKDENGEIRNVKGYLDAALKNVKESKNNFDFLKGEYTDCKPDLETVTTTSYDTCDQYFDTKQTGCMLRQIVEIDPKYTYICNKKRDVKEKLCTDILKKLTCKKNGECDGGGIVLGSVATGMEWHYDPQNSTLRLGSLGTFYWNCGNSCQKISRAAKFKIKNKPAIKAFRLKKLFLNNLLQVSLNGVVVYNSLGGNKLEITSWHKAYSRVDAGLGKVGSCMINNGRKIPDYVSIDLLPYLIEGQNEIVLDLIYSFAGHIHIEIEARQHCCTEWEEERDEQCDYL